MFSLIQLWFLAVRCKHMRSRERNKKKIVILPASTPGNLGDSAMVLGLLGILRNGEIKKFTLFDYNANESWCEELGLESEGLLPNSYEDYKAWSFSLPEISHLYINGADVLDGKYSLERSLQRLRLAYFVAHAGTPVTITGFSMRNNPPHEIVKMFRKLPGSVRLCSRDPISFGRVQSMTSCDVMQVADLAFLLQPSLNTEYERRVDLILKSEIERGKHLIGICLNLHSVQLADLDIEARVDWLISCMDEVLMRIYSINKDFYPVFIPHDYRGEWNDIRLNKLLATRFKNNDKDYFLIDEPVSASAIKQICSRFDVLITGRMHCGIAALGSGVPTIFFDYQGKVKGLAEYFGLKSTLEVQQDVVSTANEIVEHVNDFMSNLSYWKEEIIKTRPSICKLSQDNVVNVVHNL